MTGFEKEALRQQMLVRAIWHDARAAVVGGWLRGAPQAWRRGLQVYQANSGALAERALAAAFPTVAQLVGPESFAALARAYWHRAAPLRGDIAEWGGTLPTMIAGDAQLASEPYLADVARLDWAVHEAERAADDAAEPEGLDLLAQADPAHLRLMFRAGTQLVVSAHPVVSIWQAHRGGAEGDDRFAAARQALAAGRGETAFIVRSGWKAVVTALAEVDTAFTQALLAGRLLGAALQDAPAGFDFEAWLIRQLRAGSLAAVRITTTSAEGKPR